MESNKNQTGSLQSYWQKHSAPYAEQKHFMSSGHVDDLDHIVFVTFKLFNSLDVWWRIILIICCHSWEVGFLLVGSSLDLEFWNSAFETWRNWGTSLATLSFGGDQRVQFSTGSSDSSQAWCRILRHGVGSCGMVWDPAASCVSTASWSRAFSCVLAGKVATAAMSSMLWTEYLLKMASPLSPSSLIVLEPDSHS